MLFSRKSCLIFVIAMGSLVLSGCFNKSTPVEKIYDVLEKVVSTENVFKEQQEPLVELEKQEKEIYDKIISLGMKEFDEINRLSDQAIAIVDKRKDHMNKEQESIAASQKEFKKALPLINEIEEAALKEKAQTLYDTMTERYKIHDELYQQYLEGVKLDKELYLMFKKEDLQLEQLDAQITKINEIYAKILKENEEFNKKTKEYNEAKLSFYKESGLKIDSKE
ncbi:YkyA family protein [Cytobacillus massiliigabonensis]|uniref:YkyA family protein n=1 Tax=Cytobacillus massiliigabonensis TaxID=1871011 RepID=UPI001F3F60DC|nr:YkyA family protein [Cytobacillus massiliigabonensis]